MGHCIHCAKACEPKVIVMPSEKNLSVEEFMRQRRQNPAIAEREKRIEAIQQNARQAFEVASAPILRELSQVGLSLASLDTLRNSPTPYEAAVPILVRWLSLTESTEVRESIVRSL